MTLRTSLLICTLLVAACGDDNTNLASDDAGTGDPDSGGGDGDGCPCTVA